MKAQSKFFRECAFLAVLIITVIAGLSGCRGSGGAYSTPPVPPVISALGFGVTRTVDISYGVHVGDVTLYYTTDGSAPTTSSSVYSGPLFYAGYGVAPTINAIAAISGYAPSNVATSIVRIGSVLNPTGAVSLVAGAGTPGYADGPGLAAQFDIPGGVVSDGTNLYVADYLNNLIRKIVFAPSPTVSTLAISGGSISQPGRVVTDGTNLYINNYGTIINKIVIATGVMSTLAGSVTVGYLDGIGSAARFNAIEGITTDGTNLYVTDAGNSAIRKIVIATGAVTTLATGFNQPRGVTTDGTNLYVSNQNSNEVDKVVIATGAVTTLVPSTAGLNLPNGITTDGTNLFVCDTYNNEIKKVVIATGAVTTLATGFNTPYDLTTDGTNLYVADTWNYEIKEIQ